MTGRSSGWWRSRSPCGSLDRLIDKDPEQAHQALGRVTDELAQSLADLRELARGLHPAVLSDHGLQAAISALAQRSPVPVEADRRRSPSGRRSRSRSRPTT